LITFITDNQQYNSIFPDMKIDQLIEIFTTVDDFFIQFSSEINRLSIKCGNKSLRNRSTKLSTSEMMTIYISFHLSNYKNFKAYYNEYVKVYWKEHFPNLVSYERFNALQKRLILPFIVFLKYCCLGKCRGISFIDSTVLKVCHIKREKQHKVFKGIAKKAKGTMGWFFGFKLHLIINDRGELLSFYLSRANTDDRNRKIINCLVQSIFGKLFGDRGYISKVLAEYLWNDGIRLIYKTRKNMKEQNLSDVDRILLRKRALIESVNDELKNICSIEHTRHRSLKGFLNNLLAGLCAYHFLPKKPSLKFDQVKDKSQLLLNAA